MPSLPRAGSSRPTPSRWRRCAAGRRSVSCCLAGSGARGRAGRVRRVRRGASRRHGRGSSGRHGRGAGGRQGRGAGGRHGRGAGGDTGGGGCCPGGCGPGRRLRGEGGGVDAWRRRGARRPVVPVVPVEGRWWLVPDDDGVPSTGAHACSSASSACCASATARCMALVLSFGRPDPPAACPPAVGADPPE